MSQSSPDSGMTGASSADATVMTMQTGCNIRGTRGLGGRSDSELNENIKNLEWIIADNEKVLRELRRENARLKVAMQPNLHLSQG